MLDRTSNAVSLLDEERIQQQNATDTEFNPIRDIDGNIIVNPNKMELTNPLVSVDLQLQDYNTDELKKVLDFNIYELIPPDDINKFFKDYERLRRKIPGYEADLTSSYATGSKKSHEYLVATSQLYSAEVWVAKPLYLQKVRELDEANIIITEQERRLELAEPIYFHATQSYKYNKFLNHSDGDTNPVYADMRVIEDVIQPDYFVYKPIYDTAVEVSASYKQQIKSYFEYSKELLNADGTINREFNLSDTIQPRFFEIKEDYDIYNKEVPDLVLKLDDANEASFLDKDNISKIVSNMAMARVLLNDIRPIFQNDVINLDIGAIASSQTPSFYQVLLTCLINEDMFSGLKDKLIALGYTSVEYNIKNTILNHIDAVRGDLINLSGSPIYGDVWYTDIDGREYWQTEIVGYTGDPKYTQIINDMQQFVTNCREILWKIYYMGEEVINKDDLNDRDSWIVSYYDINSNSTYNLKKLAAIQNRIHRMSENDAVLVVDGGFDSGVKDKYIWLNGQTQPMYELVANIMKNDYNIKIKPEIDKANSFVSNPYTYMIDSRNNILQKSSPQYYSVDRKNKINIVMADIAMFILKMIEFLDSVNSFEQFYYGGNAPDIKNRKVNGKDDKVIYKTKDEVNRYQLYVNHVLHVQNIVMNKLKTFVNAHHYFDWDKSNNRWQAITNYISNFNSHVNNIIQSNVTYITSYVGTTIPIYYVEGKSDYKAKVLTNNKFNDGIVININGNINEDDMRDMFAAINNTIIKLLETDKAWYNGIYT